MKNLSATKFRAKCLKVIEDVCRSREAVVITKRGEPVGKLVPVDKPVACLIGRLQGIVSIIGDIESPIEPPAAWESVR